MQTPRAVIVRVGPSLLALALAASAACGDASRECRVGADCASGVCGPDGRCVAGSSPTGGDAGPLADTGSPDAPAGDAGGDAALPGCTPNKDGVITREEVPVQAGLRANYRIATDAMVSTAGTPAAGGKRVWDFAQALASDATVLVETMPLDGKWYAPKFSGATYAARLSQTYDLLGVFEVSPGAITLRGVVSPDDGVFRTELVNDPPVPALTFPLELGKTWTKTTSVSGVANGAVSVYSEDYDYQVDAAGELKTPLGSFEVLRVRGTLTRTVGLLVTTIRSFAFVTECYGTVAQVTSDTNESDVEFTQAAELRRIAP